MNILGKKIIKTSLNVSLKKDKNKLIVTNNSDKKEKIIFLKSFKSSDKKLRINSKGNLNAIENATIKVLSRRLRVIQSVDINDDAYLNNLPSKVYIGISILPKSTLEIDCLEVDLEKEEKPDVTSFVKKLKGYWTIATVKTKPKNEKNTLSNG